MVSTPKQGELALNEKQAKFVHYANLRVDRTLAEFNKITNLANKKYYDYTDGQAAAVLAALNEGLNAIAHAFHGNKPITKPRFKL